MGPRSKEETLGGREEEHQLVWFARAHGKGVEARKSKEEKQEERFQQLETAYDICNIEGKGVSTTELMDYLDISKPSLKRWIDEYGNLENISGAGKEAVYIMKNK